METKKKIGIVALCVLTLMIGGAFVSAAKDNPNSSWSQILGMFITNTETDPIPVKLVDAVTIETDETPDTMYEERILELPDGEISEVINLEGYKDLQISFVIQTGGDGLLELVWVSSEGLQVGGGVFSSTEDEWNTMSTLVKSNYLKIRIKNGAQEGDYIRLILYATK